MTPYGVGWTHPPPPIKPLQNWSSKRIVPTDNMRPKSDRGAVHMAAALAS